MCICMYVYSVYIYVDTHTHAYIYLYLCMHIYIYLYTYNHTHTHIYIYTYIYVYIITHTYIYVYIYIYVYTYTHTMHSNQYEHLFWIPKTRPTPAVRMRTPRGSTWTSTVMSSTPTRPPRPSIGQGVGSGSSIIGSMPLDACASRLQKHDFRCRCFKYEFGWTVGQAVTAACLWRYPRMRNGSKVHLHP